MAKHRKTRRARVSQKTACGAWQGVPLVQPLPPGGTSAAAGSQGPVQAVQRQPGPGQSWAYAGSPAPALGYVPGHSQAAD